MQRGFILVDKPKAWTSHDVVAKTRRITSIRKIGHAGTLDPMATGLLVLGVGAATKLLRFLQGQMKEYVTTVRFGIATDTLDADGTEIERSSMTVTRADLERVAAAHVGTIDQIPPMVSAIKVDGRRLHELARQGVEIEREPRQVYIESIDVLDVRPGSFAEADLRVRCGTGTYIRVLGDDLARALGGRAHLTDLRRTANGSLTVEQAVTIAALESAADWRTHLLDPADALAHLPAYPCAPDEARLVGNGAPITADGTDAALYRMLDGTGRLLAVYRCAGTRLVPEVVLP